MTDNKRSGEPLMTVRLNLAAIPRDGGVETRLQYLSAHLQGSLVSSVAASLEQQLKALDKSNDSKAYAFIAKLQTAKSCQYVYWGCGSCGENAALVEVYCDSTGGSQPDWSYCEGC